MADKKLNTGPAENISPEAAEPITTPEQATASPYFVSSVQRLCKEL